jgi:hypothetical protein
MKCKCLCALGVFALSVAVYAGNTPQGVERISFEGISVVNEMAPLPPGARENTVMQPFGVPVPIMRMISNEEFARGGTATGTAKAIVYRNSHDAGSGNFNKGSAAGNFVGNLLHLGNGFPVTGGEISGYDLLVYNSVSSPGGDAAATVALWDGDPLGIIDTRISDPPQPIPGTTCTFSGMEQAGLASTCNPTTLLCEGGYLDGTSCAASPTDCGLCPAISGDDIAECPGLFRLECNFDPKVAIPSRNVWMIIEWTGGCRMAWRWAYLQGPEIAAVGEQNFCGNTCPTAPVPCVDLAIEFVDAASQWGGVGVGTCCEDPGIVCDHSDGVLECGHATSCSDGVAESFSGWCFGAPSYFASFVASIYANTDTTVSLVPRGGNPVIDVAPSDNIPFDVFVAGWDSDGDGVPAVKVWQAQIDSATYVSDIAGSLTNRRTACTVNGDCTYFAEGERCGGVICAGAWQSCPASGGLCLDLPACDVSAANPRCGSTAVFSPPVVDNHAPNYGMSLGLAASADFKGCANVSFIPDPSTFLKDAASAGIPLVGYIPGTYCVEVGQCCDMSVPYPFVCLADDVTAAECADLGTTKFDSSATCADACGCQNDAQCHEGPSDDLCTLDKCIDNVCYNTDNFAAGTCCTVATGATCDINDGDQCTDDYCELAGSRGDCMHDIVDGLACDDGQNCDTVNDTCLADGSCVGTPIFDFPCTTDADCEAVDAASSCSLALGNCICQLPELSCDIQGSDKANEMCLDEGEKYLVDVLFRYTPQVVNGAQFGVYYDPTCMDFVSIAPGGDPFVFEIEEIVDEAAGYIFYAVGVDPFGGAGVSGQGVLATMSFIKIGDCNSCGITFGGDNPQDTIMVDNTGQPVTVIPVACGPVYANSDAHLTVPDGAKVNVDCDANTANVGWDAPEAWSDCYDVDLVCAGSHESGYVYPQGVVMNGGEMPIGISTFCCTATDTFCGHEVSDCWTVEVNDETSLDLTLQLSPIMAGDVDRCIDFELYADCVQAPLFFQNQMYFGGLWDHVGHFTDIKKIPSAGQWICITAMDQSHSLRATATLACVDGIYEAVFKGDPFFGGNWLIQGNLDGWKKDNPLASHDVIDILDFGQFVAMYGATFDPNTDCAGGQHGDINGDGIVDALDFSFIMENFLAVSKNSCCPDATASTTGLTSVTVRELRQMGMGDLAVADLNSDGVVNSVDMTAFMNGVQPVQKAPIRDSGSRLGTR